LYYKRSTIEPKMLSLLPHVLDDIIINYCDFNSLVDLSLVNRYFRNKIRRKEGKYLSNIVKQELAQRFDVEALCATLVETNGHISGSYLHCCLDHSHVLRAIAVYTERLSSWRVFLQHQGYRNKYENSSETLHVFYKDFPVSILDTTIKSFVVYVFSDAFTRLALGDQCRFDGRNVVVPHSDFGRMRKDYEKTRG
jgi:hypothetical protein